MAYLPLYLNSKNARGIPGEKKCGQQLVEVNLLSTCYLFYLLFLQSGKKPEIRERCEADKYLLFIIFCYLKTFKQRDLLLSAAG